MCDSEAFYLPDIVCLAVTWSLSAFGSLAAPSRYNLLYLVELVEGVDRC